MSFLSEVISVASKVDAHTIIEKTPDLENTIETTKREFLDYLDNVFVQFSYPAHQDTNFKYKINSSRNTLSQLEQCINDITKQEIQSVGLDVVAYKRNLSEAKEELQVLECLINIHDDILKVDHLLEEQKYVEVVMLAQGIEKNMDKLRSYEDLNILDDVQNEVDSAVHEIFTKMNKEVFKIIDYNSEGKNVYFKINKNNLLQELFSGYKNWDDHIQILNDIAKFLWVSIFCPIINSTVNLQIITIDNLYNLQIEILKENVKNNYKVVFKNLKIAINYFDEHFKYSLETGTTLDYIGNDIKDNLSELIIKNCLNDTIPINSEQLQNYNLIINEVEELENLLIKSGLFSNDMHYLSDHVKNVDQLYIKKKCLSYVKTAQDMMKKDLHHMIEVGEPIDLNNPFKINQDVFYQRSVSKCCLELLDFTENILKQILTNKEDCGKILFDTIENIYAQYGDTVSEHHKKLLETIPQQVALFLNNCVYISYKLTVWNEIYGKQIRKILNIEESLFSREIQSLNSIGNKTFDEFIQQQIKQIDQIMNESGLINIFTLEELQPITEKCIRQCLRQQELLKTVWHKVLSYSDYNKNLGITLNFLCNTIIEAVLKYKDISSKGGDQLVDVLKVIFTRGPKLFTDQKDVYLYVDQWHKLNELSFVLSSNLLEICDRWADGKGPLALHFKPEELKHLIRALFQNTDRRAAVLAKIQ